MLTKESIVEHIESVLRDTAGGEPEWETCTAESSITTDLGLCSADMLFVAVTLEEDYGVRFEVTELTACRTVGDIAEFILRKKGAPQK